MTVSFKCSEIAEAIGADLIGDSGTVITSIAPIESASQGAITFVTNPGYVEALRSSAASAVILGSDLVDETDATRLVVDDPYLAYAKLTHLWVSHPSLNKSPSVHPSSSIANTAIVAEQVSIGANAVVDEHVELQGDVVVGSGAYIGQGCVIGEGTKIHPNATLLRGCVVGRDCEIHSGAVIGADGFGFAPTPSGWDKIHQIGGVSIGDRVSIGACTTIDRGALENTIIADGVILDNHIQVAHNCSIGKNTAIAGCTGIAGSTTIGEGLLSLTAQLLNLEVTRLVSHCRHQHSGAKTQYGCTSSMNSAGR